MKLIILSCLCFLSSYCYSQITQDTIGLRGEWEMVGDDRFDSIFINSDLIIKLNQEGTSIVSFFIKQIHLNYESYRDVTEISKFSLNCTSNRIRLEESSLYTNTRKFIKGNGFTDPQWSDIKYNTFSDKISKAACYKLKASNNVILKSNDLIAFNKENKSNWVYSFSDNSRNIWYVNKEYISKSNKTIKVWVKVESPKIIIKKKLYKNVEQKYLITFDCKSYRTQTLRMITYSNTNSVIQDINSDYENFEDIIPGSVIERVSKTVCSLFND